MEDAFVLAEELHAAETVQQAFAAFQARRHPRVTWVQDQSRVAAQAWVMPIEARNAALRERGDDMFQNRYGPLIPRP